MPSPNAVHVVLADRHQMMRVGLRAVLASDPNLAVVGEAADVPELVTHLEAHQPDVVVLAAGLAETDGPRLIRDIARRSPRTRVVYLMFHPSGATREAVLAAGAQACLLKEAGARVLLEAVCAAGVAARHDRAQSRDPSAA